MPPTPLLLLSNGHGEDTIGATLVPSLRARGFAVEALPIVGDGGPYRRLGVPIVGPTAAMPSGGFVYGRPAALAADVGAGLVGLTRAQLAALKAARGRYPLAVAIGDIVPLAFAWYARTPFAFVGCAKSDYYLHGRPGSYFWHERLLLRHPLCREAYPRDAVTTENLMRAGVSARYLGNPMMDGLSPSGAPLPGPADVPTLAIVPGSRREAVANFARLVPAALAAWRTAPGSRPRLLAAIAPGLEAEAFVPPGWTRDGTCLRHPDGATIHLLPGRFADVAHAADAALAMAGTATEQLVGLGKPVVATPGAGPQFTAAFAEAQTRLLGESVQVVDPRPEAMAAAIWDLLGDPERLARLAENGRTRMGPPGASERIAGAIANLLPG